MLFLAANKLKATISSGLRNMMWCGLRSPQRQQIWENIAAALNSLQQPNRVTASQELFEIGIYF